MLIIYGAAAIVACITGMFTFKLSPFVGSLFMVTALAFVVIAFIVATQKGDTQR